jgi:hypothetical protein
MAENNYHPAEERVTDGCWLRGEVGKERLQNHISRASNITTWHQFRFFDTLYLLIYLKFITENLKTDPLFHALRTSLNHKLNYGGTSSRYAGQTQMYV